MLVATMRRNGRQALVLGLSSENMRRLANDQPLERNLGEVPVPDLEGWDVIILGPEDSARFIAHARPEQVGEWPG